MSEGQSIVPREYRYSGICASGKPVGGFDTLADVKDDDRTDFGKRLVAARKHANLTQANLAKAVGMGQSTLAEAEKTAQGSSFTAQLAAACGVSAEWLAEGKGEMVLRPAGLEGALPVPPSRLRPVAVVGRGNGGVMPAVIWTDGDYPAGYTGEYGDGVASSDPHAFLAEVDGVSMVPKYTPGNFALVEPGTDIDIEDDVLVRLVSGETLLKRLVSRRGGYALSSYNDSVVRYLRQDEVEWMYYVVCPIPRKKIKMRT